MSSDTASMGRIRRTLWTLTLIATLAAGSLSTSIQAPRGAVTGMRVLGSGLVLLATVSLATRVLVVVERKRQSGNRDRHHRG